MNYSPFRRSNWTATTQFWIKPTWFQQKERDAALWSTSFREKTISPVWFTCSNPWFFAAQVHILRHLRAPYCWPPWALGATPSKACALVRLWCVCVSTTNITFSLRANQGVPVLSHPILTATVRIRYCFLLSLFYRKVQWLAQVHTVLKVPEPVFETRQSNSSTHFPNHPSRAFPPPIAFSATPFQRDLHLWNPTSLIFLFILSSEAWVLFRQVPWHLSKWTINYLMVSPKYFNHAGQNGV